MPSLCLFKGGEFSFLSHLKTFLRLPIDIVLFLASKYYLDIPPAHLRSFPEIVSWSSPSIFPKIIVAFAAKNCIRTRLCRFFFVLHW